MAETKLNIAASLQWFETDPDGCPCAICEETIYGRMFELKVIFNNTAIESEKNKRVCQSCYQLLKDNT